MTDVLYTRLLNVWWLEWMMRWELTIDCWEVANDA